MEKGDPPVKLEGKTIFMTGANGFLGSRIAQRLAGMGAKVRALVRKAGAAPELQSRQVEEVQGEFTDPVAVAEGVKGAQFVIWVPSRLRRPAPMKAS